MNDKYFAWDPRGFSRRMPRPFSAGVGEPNSGKNGTAESTYRCEGWRNADDSVKPWVRHGAEGRIRSHPAVLRVLWSWNRRNDAPPPRTNVCASEYWNHSRFRSSER